MFVFLTDNELGFAHPGGLMAADYTEFCKGADLLLHDAEYTPQEYKFLMEWGHSSYVDVLNLAFEAGVKRLGLFHHNQERTDDEVDEIVQDCHKIIKKRKSDLDCFAVGMGMSFEPVTEPTEQAASLLVRSRSAVALTGAGISVESGIPPFRGKGGLWEKLDPMQYAHIDAYERNPAQVWKMLFLGLKTVLQEAKPNDGHYGLFHLEQMGIVHTIVTQNIDGLHQRAGSRDVIELHGTFAVQRCMQCDGRLDSSRLNLDNLPPKCVCGGILRPDVVMFGEMIPFASFATRPDAGFELRLDACRGNVCDGGTCRTSAGDCQACGGPP